MYELFSLLRIKSSYDLLQGFSKLVYLDMSLIMKFKKVHTSNLINIKLAPMPYKY